MGAPHLTASLCSPVCPNWHPIPYIVHYIWSKGVHYLGNRVLFVTRSLCPQASCLSRACLLLSPPASMKPTVYSLAAGPGASSEGEHCTALPRQWCHMGNRRISCSDYSARKGCGANANPRIHGSGHFKVTLFSITTEWKSEKSFYSHLGLLLAWSGLEERGVCVGP